MRLDEATAFTLFGEVLTGESVGVEEHACRDEGTCEVSVSEAARRLGLPLL